MTQLVLVEGIPGSGKTRAAQFIADWFSQRGFETALYLEGNWDHPADFESVACLNSSEFQQIRAQFPQQAEFLDQKATVQEGEYFFSYRQMEHHAGDPVSPELIEALARYEIYELPIKTFQRLLLARWRAFASRATHGNQIFIFECCFLQNPLTMFLGRNTESIAASKAFILEIAESIKILSPRLVHLHPGDVETTLRRVAQLRPPEWLNFVIAYHTQQGQGKTRGWQGFSGLVNFYEMRQRLELELLPQMPFPVLALQQTDWAQDYAQIEDFLTPIINT